MVTMEPLPRVAKTIPPGCSRMNAPPPSEARMIARMGVGSAVTVAVDVSVAGSVACEGVALWVRDGVLVRTPLTAVDCSGLGDTVRVETGAEVDIAIVAVVG